MKKVDYYKAPPQEVFDEIKKESIRIWKTYDDTYGYATEKINRIEDMQNIKDNAYFIIAMFDYNNMKRLNERLEKEAKEYLQPILAKQTEAMLNLNLMRIFL